MQKIIILDYSDWDVKVINWIKDNLQLEQIEDILVDDYNLKLSEIEYMTSPDLIVKNLN